nr:histone-lysine N-methyltransferase, H3 lysine-9 specific SUVH4-like [Tanacetum cinerariifolium]
FELLGSVVDSELEAADESDPEFCIDARSIGNVARFINHSCDPNLFVQCVVSSHHDIKLARIVLVAAENIPPKQELTYDYGFELLGSVVDSELEAADESDPEFCIDARSIGNVARFINHSCDPNLFVQCVVSSHHDIKLARIVLVAAENIPPKQELTYDYGYALDSVGDENGMVKTLTCHCGTSKCRGRLD